MVCGKGAPDPRNNFTIPPEAVTPVFAFRCSARLKKQKAPAKREIGFPFSCGTRSGQVPVVVTYLLQQRVFVELGDEDWTVDPLTRVLCALAHVTIVISGWWVCVRWSQCSRTDVACLAHHLLLGPALSRTAVLKPL